jgi:hypothetical protein
MTSDLDLARNVDNHLVRDLGVRLRLARSTVCVLLACARISEDRRHEYPPAPFCGGRHSGRTNDWDAISFPTGIRCVQVSASR